MLMSVLTPLPRLHAALAQPLSAQVAAALAVPGRLLARSQLPRCHMNPAQPVHRVSARLALVQHSAAQRCWRPGC